MGFASTALLIIVVLHFIVGFGYLIIKLSPKKGSTKRDNGEKNIENTIK